MRVWEEWDHGQVRVGGLLNEPEGLCLKEGFGAGRGGDLEYKALATYT